MAVVKAFTVLILIMFGFCTYVLTEKGWVLYQAILGSVGLTFVATGLFIVPGIAAAVVYQFFERLAKDSASS